MATSSQTHNTCNRSRNR